MTKIKYEKKAEKSRKFLTEDEVLQLIEATKHTDHSTRNKAMVILTYNHALRTSEICNLKWTDVDFERKTIMIRRKKNGKDFIHPLMPSEYEVLTQLYEQRVENFPYLFRTQKKSQFERHGIKWLFYNLAKYCNIATHFSSRSLRHAKGVWLREQGERMEDIADWLGHRSLMSTQIYTSMGVSPKFKSINEGSKIS